MPKPKPFPPPLIDADLHAESFRQVREAHRVELVEDYVELISDLIRDGGEARQVDIAARRGVAQPTVAKMLKRPVKAGFSSDERRVGKGCVRAGRSWGSPVQ